MSIVADPVAGAPVNELRELLHTGDEGYECLLSDLLDDMEVMCRALDEQREQFEGRFQSIESEKQQLAQTLNERPVPVESTEGNPELESKITELEQDRQSLEEELEEVRARATDLARTLTEQKRQMAEERAEWAAELRQLRRVLDKQANWIAQQSQQAATHAAALQEPAGNTVSLGSGPATVPAAGGYPAPAPPAANRDPVLGSVLSQFELLRKDLERRRAPPKIGGGKNVNAS